MDLRGHGGVSDQYSDEYERSGRDPHAHHAVGAHDFSTVASFIGKKQKYNGWDSGGEVNGFKGSIDEVAIFDKALSDAQIRQILAAAEVPPIILVHPQAPPPPVYEGMTLSLSVVADAGASVSPLAYQWTRNGIPISGQTATNFAISNLATSDTANYAVVVTNTFGAVGFAAFGAAA